MRQVYRALFIDGPHNGMNYDTTWIPQSLVVVSGDIYDRITCIAKHNDKDHIYYLWRGYKARPESRLP